MDYLIQKYVFKVYANIYIFKKALKSQMSLSLAMFSVCSKMQLCSSGVQNTGTLGLVGGVGRTDTNTKEPSI